MRLSDIIADEINRMLDESGDGSAEIKRNELASHIGCVPSQINYVISSRFVPEQGYIVESRRGGLLTDGAARLMYSAISSQVMSNVPVGLRDALRAAAVKQMLLSQV